MTGFCFFFDAEILVSLRLRKLALFTRLLEKKRNPHSGETGLIFPTVQSFLGWMQTFGLPRGLIH